MPKVFNYTERRSIKRSDVQIEVFNDGNELKCRVFTQLKAYDFPPTAHVYVEAYRRLSALWKRCSLGRIGYPESNELSLAEFGYPEALLFRLKIATGDPENGRLLGEVDAIRPKTDGKADDVGPLIDVDKGPIGGELWQVKFPESEVAMPTLIINEKIEDWNSRARDPLFRGLVLPCVMRLILTQILVFDANVGDEDNIESWRQRWLSFAEGLPGVGEHPGELHDGENLNNRGDLSDWIDRAVSRFGNESGLADMLINKWNREIEQ